MNRFRYNENFNDFLSRIDLTEKDKQLLTNGRKLIRDRIRTAFNEEERRSFSHDSIVHLKPFISHQDGKISPKFMTQGSYAYNTINKPCFPPVQQMDLDDGVYLPSGYVEKQTADFNKAAKIVREIIYNTLSRLCREEEWELSKHSKCLRISINNESHIDVPIYSIPDEQLETIRDQAFKKSQNSINFDSTSPVNREEVLLATDDGWIESDPRVIHDWVKESTKRHSNKFKKYSRLIKAWRDFQFKESNLSSIMIMAGIEQALRGDDCSEETISIDLSRKVNRMIMDIEDTGILDPDTGDRLDKRLEQDRDLVLTKLKTLAINLDKAVREENLQFLVECFGDRFPQDSQDSNCKNMPIGTGAPAIVVNPICFSPIKPARNG